MNGETGCQIPPFILSLSKDESRDFRMKQVALITGASGGLGRALSLRFAESGFAVAVNYFHGKEAAEDLVSEIISNGGDAEPFYCDVKSSGNVINMIDQ